MVYIFLFVCMRVMDVVELNLIDDLIDFLLNVSFVFVIFDDDMFNGIWIEIKLYK